MKKAFLILFALSSIMLFADDEYVLICRKIVSDPSKIEYRGLRYYNGYIYLTIKNNTVSQQIIPVFLDSNSPSLIRYLNLMAGKIILNEWDYISIEEFEIECNKTEKGRLLLKSIINEEEINYHEFHNLENVNYLYDANGLKNGFYSEDGIYYGLNEDSYYSNGEKALFSTETDENGNLIYKIITSDTSKALIHSFADQLKKLAENTEIRLFAAVMVIVGGFVAFCLVKRGLNWLKMEPYYSDLDKAYEAYKKGEVGDFTLNKALGRDYKRYKMKNSQWHYGKNGKVVFDNTDGVMSFREFSKNRLKDRWKYKNQYDAKKNEGFKKYVDKKQKIEDLEFKRLPDEQLSADDYMKKYEKEIKGFVVHNMNQYRSYDETYLRKGYMEKGIYNEETEQEIQNMLNIIEEENRKSDQEFFDKQEEIYNESPIDSMEWHYPISEA